MHTNTRTALLCITSLFSFAYLAIAGDIKQVSAVAGKAKPQIIIKDFHFSPQTLTVKTGEKVSWVNRDEEPHTVVSVEKQFKKSPPLDTDEEFTVTAGAPGTYTYFCSVHPMMTGTIIVEK